MKKKQEHVWPDLSFTKRALKKFDKDWEVIQSSFDRVRDDKDVKLCGIAEKGAKLAVQLAFYKDTTDRNSIDGCMVIPLKTLREMVDKSEQM